MIQMFKQNIYPVVEYPLSVSQEIIIAEWFKALYIKEVDHKQLVMAMEREMFGEP